MNIHWIGIKEIGYSHLLTVIYILIVKAGFPSILFYCSSYIKEMILILRDYKSRIININISEENNHYISPQLYSTEENKNNKKDSSINNFFFTHISLIFLPLPLSFLLQVVSLYILSYIGCTVDVQKQMHYLIYCLVQAVSTIFSLLPIIF